MKTNTQSGKWGATIFVSVLGVMLLLATTGCNCININIGGGIPGGPGNPGDPNNWSPPSGGAFVPVQSTIGNYGGSTTICTPPQQISTKFVRFYPPNQIPNPGENGFRGYLLNMNNNQILSNNTYVLQWIVNSTNMGCATPVPNSSTEVYFPASYPYAYKLAAHFKVGGVPSGSPLPPIKIFGTWITQ